MNYEFNYIYEHFELFENYKDIYVDKLLNDISEIKNKIETKFSLIFDYFFEYLKTGWNYVDNNFIENLKINNTKCYSMLSDLYLNIAIELNNTNITESDDYIINNCTIELIINTLFNNFNYSNYTDATCLNISEINDTVYLNEYNFLFTYCKNNNFYNYSYIIYENFQEGEKKYYDEIVSNISQIINDNITDEKYLYNYIRDNYKNSSLEIDINEYRFYFEDIEDMNFYINNLKEPEYKKLMNDILIESFNKSYSDIVNSYLTNEIINKINVIANDKLEIFINYYSNKLKTDYEYYEMLLGDIEELGNSSKVAIINLFSKIPNTLNESIYYLLENDIFYSIELFFRENKNIFIDNFIEFYLNNENHFNLNIYKINDYVKEMIADRNFNKTLNNISLFLINKIKNDMENNVKNSLLAKINSLNQQCNLLTNNIKIRLNQIKTSELSEEMENLVKLIKDYSFLVENQNNKYNFKVRQNPFNILNIFIHNELEPPLLLISDKYDSIEKELLNRIKTLAEDFPDCYSDIRLNLLGTKIDSIDNLTNQINYTLIEYQNILINEIEKYLSKLIHFTFIDGLETVSSSCEEFDCDIETNSLRNLDENRNLNIMNIYKGHPLLINKTGLEKNIRTKGIFDIKRKVSSFPEYTSDMGALSEDNILYYLSNLQNSVLNLNKSYFGRDYLNINSTSIKFITKMNFTCLEKLRLSFDLKLVKFSSILTEKSMQELKDIILSQFYLIEKYVHQSSDLVQYKINYFLNEINNTSAFIESLSGYIHNQVLGYYKILYTTIQNKYEDLGNKKQIIESEHSHNNHNKTKVTVLEIVSLFQSEIQFNFNWTLIFSKIKDFFNITSKFSFLDKLVNYTKKGKAFSKTLSIPFPAFPYFQIVFNFSAYAGLGFGISPNVNWTNFEVSLVFDVYVEAKVPMQIEAGLYFPPSKSPVQIAMVLGLDGIIGHGRAGIKLEISLRNGETDCDAYFIINALVFQFYFQIKITIDLPLFHFGYSFDIIRVELFGLHLELHSLKKARQEAFKKNKMFGFNFQGKDILSPEPQGKDIIVK